MTPSRLRAEARAEVHRTMSGTTSDFDVLQRVLTARRSCRGYTAEPVARDVIEQVRARDALSAAAVDHVVGTPPRGSRRPGHPSPTP